ncbi:MAG: 3-dehydroquinate dehydratase [Rickettsiales bacterium]|nr:3-dehydroquinate dehydratase [Rickettsiales bacterium]
MKSLLINGPNLNLLELRETEHYQNISLSEIELNTKQYALKNDINLVAKQSNHEGEIIEFIHDAVRSNYYKAIIINAGAYTHTSIAILDALKIFKGLVIEVHLSDITKREEFRKNSYISLRADQIFFGEGAKSYLKAIDYLRGLDNV